MVTLHCVIVTTFLIVTLRYLDSESPSWLSANIKIPVAESLLPLVSPSICDRWEFHKEDAGVCTSTYIRRITNCEVSRCQEFT